MSNYSYPSSSYSIETQSGALSTEDYNIVPVMLFNGLSNDFPYVALPLLQLSRPKGRAYLIPHTIFACSDPLYELSKSQRNKLHNYHGIMPGTKVEILVFHNDNIAQAISFEERTKKFSNSEGLRPNQFKVECVFDENIIHRKCFVGALQFNVDCALNPLEPAPIPNLVYEAVLDCIWNINNNGGVQCGVNTELRLLRMQISRVIGIKRFCINDLPQTLDLPQHCRWIALRIQNGQIRVPYQRHSDSPVPPLVPSPPIRIIENVLLWYFDCNGQTQIIMECRPGTFIRFNPDPGHEWRYKGTTLTYPPLCDGELFTANIIYSEFIRDSQDGFGAYYIQDYWKSNKKSKQIILPRKAVVERLDQECRYNVPIKESCLFKEFYVCDELRYCLIADQNKVLRNIDWERHRINGCRVWIRLEKDHCRLAHFSIAALDRENGDFKKAEKMLEYPNIHGVGIMVDLSGAVLAQSHPQTRIRLSTPDKHRVRIGHFFNFSATYWAAKKLYVIGNWQMITCKEPVKTFRIGQKLFFKNRLQFSTIQMGHKMHLSAEFGPVLDEVELVSCKAKKEGTHYPKTVDAFVCYNPDWTPGRDAQMALHSLTLPEDEMVDVTSTIADSAQKWWAPGHLSDDGACRCNELWHLLQEVKQTKKRGLKETTRKTIEELLQRTKQMTEKHE